MGQVIELLVDQFLIIDQGDLANNPRGEAVYQTLVLTDLAKDYRIVLFAQQTVTFGQVAATRQSVCNLSISNYLAFYQSGGNGPDLQSLVQFLHIGQEAKVVEYEPVSHSISFTQSSSCELAKVATVTLVMSDETDYNLIRSIVVVHTLIVGSSGTGYVLKEESYSIPIPILTGPNVPEC